MMWNRSARAPGDDKYSCQLFAGSSCLLEADHHLKTLGDSVTHQVDKQLRHLARAVDLSNEHNSTWRKEALDTSDRAAGGLGQSGTHAHQLNRQRQCQ